MAVTITPELRAEIEATREAEAALRGVAAKLPEGSVTRASLERIARRVGTLARYADRYPDVIALARNSRRRVE